ncbi:MAG: cytochrome c biogenesis protein ResB, partial [Candidatus Krumholzibacteriia bacterium]
MVDVQGFFKNPVIAFLTSLKLSAVLMTVFAVASGYATFFESAWGRDGAYAAIYGARWFELLLALLTVNMALLFFKRWPYDRRQLGFVLVHISIVVILVGAGITRYFGYEGIMPIREGQSTDFVYSDKSHVQAWLGDERASFPVRPYRHGMRPIVKTIELGDRKYKLGITEYWPFYEEKLQEGPGGPAAFAYTSPERGELVQKTMMQGNKTAIGGIDARFLDGDFSGTMTGSRLGEVRVHFDGKHCEFPVAWPAAGAHECHGWTFTVTELQTDFKVGAPSSADGPLRNPMIRLAIAAPDGRRGEKILFAHHPDFSMGQGGDKEEFADLDVIYQVASGIEFAPGGATGVRARASFDLETMDMNTNDQGEVAAGTVFELQPSLLYANSAENFSFVPVEVWRSAVSAPALSSDTNAPAAARLVLRDDQGNEAAAICVKHRNAQPVELGGQRFRLEFGAIRIPLPYEVHLDDFVLQTYPGSDNPATYESYVTLKDPELGIEGRKVHVYMNHPMNHRGSKHFQSSYDPDRKGTVLSVNHDPGKWPTYFGYFLISLGFILILLKDLLWPRRKRDGSGSYADEASHMTV